jgi:hypothetical protein
MPDPNKKINYDSIPMSNKTIKKLVSNKTHWDAEPKSSRRYTYKQTSSGVEMYEDKKRNPLGKRNDSKSIDSLNRHSILRGNKGAYVAPQNTNTDKVQKMLDKMSENSFKRYSILYNKKNK